MRATIVTLILLAALAAAAVLVWLGTFDDPARSRRDAPGGERAPASGASTSGASAPGLSAAPSGDGADGSSPADRATLRGLCVEAADGETPVEGVEVVARWIRTGTPGTLGRTTTGADGRFSLAIAGSGWVELTALHPRWRLAAAYARPGEGPVTIPLETGTPVAVVVLRPDRTPAAGARIGATWTEVSTYEQGGRTQSFTFRESLAPRTAGPDGRAALGALASPEVDVWAETAAFARTTRTVTLDDGRVRPETVEIEIVLEPGGVIEGRVTDRAGDPVPGARVHPGGDDLRVATAGPEGYYRLDAVGPGDVRVVAEAEGYGPASFGEQLGWGRAVPVPVARGEVVTGIDLVLGPGTSVRGRVVDVEGAPVAGVQVVVDPMRERTIVETTDAAGRFAAGPWSPDTPMAFEVRVVGFGWHVDVPGQEPLRPGETRVLDDLVARRLDTVEGRVLDVDGTPAAGATVILSVFNESTDTAPDGTFTLPARRAEGATLEAVAREPYRRSRPLPFKPGGSEGEEEKPVLRLEPTHRIAGFVRTPEGQPRPGITVGIARADGENEARVEDMDATDADGRFRYVGLLSGRYRVGIADFVERDGGWFRELRADPPPVEVAAGEEGIVLTLPYEGGWVTGRVVRAADGLPVPEFGVAAYRYRFFIPNWEDSTRFEDGQGRFRMELEEAGTWAVDIHADGLASVRSGKFRLEPGKTVDLGILRLGAGGAIEGRVTGPAGEPVQWTRIYVLNAKLQTNSRAPWTDRAGRFTVDGLTPGTYQVFAVSPLHPLALARGIEVGEGATARVSLQFADSAPLTVRVVDGRGEPVEGAKLVWTFPALAPIDSSAFGSYEPPGYGRNTSGPDGTIHKPYLPAAEITWRIEADGFAPTGGKTTLEAGVPATVEARLTRIG